MSGTDFVKVAKCHKHWLIAGVLKSLNKCGLDTLLKDCFDKDKI